MRRLRGGIPRAFASHRTPEAASYGCYCRAKMARLGSLPPDARPWLREAGLLVLTLGRLHQETEAAHQALDGAGRRRREQLRVMLRQLERRAGRLRGQLASAEARLEELAAKPPADPLAELFWNPGHGRSG